MEQIIVYRSPLEAIFWDFFMNSGLALPFMAAIFVFLVTIASLDKFLNSPKMRMNSKARSIRNNGYAMLAISLIPTGIVFLVL